MLKRVVEIAARVRLQKWASPWPGSKNGENRCTLLAATAHFYLIFAAICLYCPTAEAKLKTYRIENYSPAEGFNGMREVFIPGETPISPFNAPPPQYDNWDNLSKSERKFELAQAAVQAVGMTLHGSKLGKGILALREPFESKNNKVKCRQKFSLKKYYLSCGIKF